MDLDTYSNENKLYYYNVDAILSELIRPPTPKCANLARPKLVKPAPIRPEQLVVAAGSGLNPFVLDDRNEGARNPDPSWAMDEDDAAFVSPEKNEAPYSMVQPESCSLLELLGKRNRDDEDANFVGRFNQVHRVPSRQNIFQDFQYPYAYAAQPPFVVYNTSEEMATPSPSAGTMPCLLPQLIKPIAMRPVDLFKRYHDIVQENASESYEEASSMQVCG
jgi:hypothetical protein